MARALPKNTQRAMAMLEKFHPRYPDRHYTPYEVSQKTGVGLSTIYRHIKKQEEAAALAAQQTEGE